MLPVATVAVVALPVEVAAMCCWYRSWRSVADSSDGALPAVVMTVDSSEFDAMRL